MSTDDRLSRHLAAQASTISLAPADPAEVKRRGARRRNRRRVAVVGCAAALALVATSVATLDAGDRDDSLALGSGEVSVDRSTYDWTVVTPTSGLGFSRSQVQLAGGALYGLSSAPGAAVEANQAEPPRLYRSDDGAEWEAVELPDELSASSLAASGDTLYAIGTAPAGGGSRDLVVVASSDRARTWSQLELPSEVRELDARHPGKVAISSLSIAARDATHLVASVVVTTVVDFSVVPESGGATRWEYTDDGLTVHAVEACSVGTSGGAACEDPAVAPSTTAVGPGGEITTDTVRQAGGEPDSIIGTYSWDELGVAPELRAMVRGRTYLYASDDGATFRPVDLPEGTGGWGSQVVATDDGYHLFAPRSGTASQATTMVLRSGDGHTWTRSGELAGSPLRSGSLAGRPAVALYQPDGTTVLRAGLEDGSWATTDLSALLDGETGKVDVYEVAFGPLGLAAVVAVRDGDDAVPALHLLHSTDGVAFATVAVRDALADLDGHTSRLSVTADGIFLSLTGPPDDDDTTPPTQRVLVGTPTG